MHGSIKSQFGIHTTCTVGVNMGEGGMGLHINDKSRVVGKLKLHDTTVAFLSPISPLSP